MIEKLKKLLKKLKYYIFILIAVLIALGIPALLLRYGGDMIYPIPLTENGASFLGGIYGGVVGGIGTLLAVLFSIRDTASVQKAHQRELEYKERKDFVDNIVALTARYSTDISRYYFRCKRQLRLQKDLEAAHNEHNTVLEKRLERELNHLIINRTISIECWYVLRMKLKGLPLADTYLEQLDEIHNNYSVKEEITCDEFHQAVERLNELAVQFGNDYLKEYRPK